jgi:ribosomal protein S18 acetylase RimI-like enzyme
MRGVEIQPFTDEHVDAAAALLEQRHARHREAEPLLPANVDFRADIEAVWMGEAASGVVAIRAGEVVGYLLGIRRDDAMWGPNVWIELAGHAVQDPEIVRDLYGVAAANWVEEGRNRHYAFVPATDDELVDAWFRLSFGAQHAAGIQETPSTLDRSPPGVEVREAVAEDIDAAIALDRILPQHQERAPVFSSVPSWTDEELRDDLLGDVDDPEVGLFIAELEGRPVGLLTMVSAEKSNMHSGLARPVPAALLACAATLPESRGSGAGVALTNAGLAWARDQDYPVVVTDWRETNLLSSRFWPARGFRRTFRRLYRSIP